MESTQETNKEIIKAYGEFRKLSEFFWEFFYCFDYQEEIDFFEKILKKSYYSYNPFIKSAVYIDRNYKAISGKRTTPPT